MSLLDKVSLLGVAHARTWKRDTALHPEAWSLDNPSRDHCVVVSLSTQSLLGGRIVNGRPFLLDGSQDSHYWNVIGDREVDYTWQQYPDGVEKPVGVPRRKEFGSTREYLLSSEDVRSRFSVYHGRLLWSLHDMGFGRRGLSVREQEIARELLIGTHYAV